MKNLGTFTVLFCVCAIFMFSCDNPKKDAEKFCDCLGNAMQNIKTDPNDPSHSLQKCMALGAEMELKYKEKPQQLLDYRLYLDSCNKKNTKLSN